MIILVDSREQDPLDFSPYPDVQAKTVGLFAGDYSLPGLERTIGFERKSLDDLTGSLTSGRERFENELSRARGYQIFDIVIEGTMQDVQAHRYRSKVLPQSVLQSLFAYRVRYRCGIVWSGDREGAALYIHSVAEKFLTHAQRTLKEIVKAQEQPQCP